MNRTSLRFKIIDALFIAMMVLPLLCGVVLQVLTKPVVEGVSVVGVYAAKKLVLIRGAAEFDALSAACEAEGLQLDGTEE